MEISSGTKIRWHWYDNASDSFVFDYRVPMLVNSTEPAFTATVTGSELNTSNGLDIKLINTTTMIVVDPVAASQENENRGHRLSSVFTDATNDGWFNLSDTLEYTTTFPVNRTRLVYIYFTTRG